MLANVNLIRGEILTQGLVTLPLVCLYLFELSKSTQKSSQEYFLCIKIYKVQYKEPISLITYFNQLHNKRLNMTGYKCKL